MRIVRSDLIFRGDDVDVAIGTKRAQALQIWCTSILLSHWAQAGSVDPSQVRKNGAKLMTNGCMLLITIFTDQ